MWATALILKYVPSTNMANQLNTQWLLVAGDLTRRF